MTRLTSRDRRAVTLGGAVILAVVGIGQGLPRWHRWVTGERDRARQAEVRVARLRAIIREQQRLSDSVAARRTEYLNLAPRLLDGDTPATAGASLLAMVSGAANGSGLQVGFVQSISDSAGQRFVRVAVRGEATGDATGLADFLEILEGGSVVTRVRELSVDQPEPAAPPEQAEALRIHFVVEGIALRQARTN